MLLIPIFPRLRGSTAKQGLSFVVRWMPRPLFVQCTDGSSERQQLSGFYSPSCKGSVNLSLLSANGKVWDDRKPLKNALTRLCSPCGAAFFRREGKPSSRVSGLEADLQSRGRWKERRESWLAGVGRFLKKRSAWIRGNLPCQKTWLAQQMWG